MWRLALPIALLVLLAVSVADSAVTQQLFVNTTYYFLLLTVLVWVGTYLHAARELRRETVVAWLRENWPGLLIAVLVTAVVAYSVQPALRVLSDEANLVGVSKNLFTSRTATLTVSGKNYYENYWDIDVVIDRRPTLFPFLVSLVHVVRGYSHHNVFTFNLLVLHAFLLLSYRFAKSLGGESFGIVSALFVAAHPMTLISARSGGFDLFAAAFALLVIKSFSDFVHHASPSKLALLWMNLCLFAEIRYETALFMPVCLALLALFKAVNWNALRPYGLVYALTPAYLLPRIWQAILLGNVPEQEPHTITFSSQNFLHNASEYFKPVFSPLAYPAHSGILIALGIVGGVHWSYWLLGRVRARDWSSPKTRLSLLVAAWVCLQAVICFSYFWGQAQYPSSARLVIALDTFLSFAAAWTVTLIVRLFRAFVPVLLAIAVLVFELPIASQHRLLSRLTQTRESAATWGFFERLGEKRILIVSDRPNLFTIMDYGALSFDAARSDPYLLTAFARHLFQDVYVIQQIEISSNEPLPGYAIWPTRKLEPMLEFQNDANVLVRVSRLAH